jgi:high-affinity nickel permease
MANPVLQAIESKIAGLIGNLGSNTFLVELGKLHQFVLTEVAKVEQEVVKDAIAAVETNAEAPAAKE